MVLFSLFALFSFSYLGQSFFLRVVQYKGTLSWVTDGTGTLLLGGSCVWFIVLLYASVCERFKGLNLVVPKIDWAFYIVLSFIMHLVVACLYFSYVYNSAGTFKPQWTEKLG